MGASGSFFGVWAVVIGGLDVCGVGWRHGIEAGCVRCGLRVELGEVEVRTGAVSDIHRLA